jgi:hypothetical protein
MLQCTAWGQAKQVCVVHLCACSEVHVTAGTARCQPVRQSCTPPAIAMAVDLAASVERH